MLLAKYQQRGIDDIRGDLRTTDRAQCRRALTTHLVAILRDASNDYAKAVDAASEAQRAVAAERVRGNKARDHAKALAADLARTKDEVLALKRKLAKQPRSALQEQVRSARATIQELRQELETVTERAQRTEQDYAVVNAQLDRVEAAYDDKRNENEALREARTELTAQYDQTQQELASLLHLSKQDTTELLANLEAAREEAKQMETAAGQATRRCEASAVKIRHLEDLNADLAAQCRVLQAQVDAAQQDAASAHATTVSADRLQSVNVELRHKNHELKEDLLELHKRYAFSKLAEDSWKERAEEAEAAVRDRDAEIAWLEQYKPTEQETIGAVAVVSPSAPAALHYSVDSTPSESTSGEPVVEPMPSPSFTSDGIVPSGSPVPSSGDASASTLAPLVNQISMDDVELGRMLGAGGFGFVVEGVLKLRVAVKKLYCGHPRPEDVEDFEREVGIMAIIEHVHICKLIGASFDISNMAMLVEMAERGSLWDILQHDPDSLSMETRERMVLETARGMQYLHGLENPIVHRDLKTPNLLVTSSNSIKISDFGLACFKSEIGTSSMLGPCGTTAWMAPEVLRGDPYDERADVFSFGVVMWEILTGEQPFQGSTDAQIEAFVLSNGRLPIYEDFPASWARLMNWCWAPNPANRPSFGQIIEYWEGKFPERSL